VRIAGPVVTVLVAGISAAVVAAAEPPAGPEAARLIDLTWSFPQSVLARSAVHLCEPGVVRSPDGRRLAVLLRENARRKNSHIMFSSDQGDCAYPGVEVLPDGTFVATTYGHWTPGESPYIVSVRLGLAELDALGAEP
jgi:hypothetical protein